MSDSLLDLHRAGRVAERYPEVRALLADLDENELAAAGRLLSRVDPEDVLRAHGDTASVRIAITGHGMVAELVPALTAELARHGLLMRHTLGDFGAYFTDLCAPDSALHAARPDLVLCVLDPMAVFDLVPTPWRAADARIALDRVLGTLDAMAARFTALSDATLVLNTIPLPREFTARLLDHRSRARLGALWREGNARLLRLAEQYPGVVVLDLDPILGDGVPLCDPRMSTYAKAHLSTPLLARYAREVGHLVRHLTGRTKKCLALDLDGTLWGGVLGDDGAEGIEIGDTPQGEAFRSFQRLIRQLAAQGVLVTAVSKNDEGAVRRVLADHPDMVLRESDFVRLAVNFHPKPDNIKTLAGELGLATDSFVFVDDTPAECGLVRRWTPEVAVVAVDREPALHAAKLLRDGWFDVRELTEADAARSARYRAEAERRDFRTTFDNVDAYLADLGIEVRLAPLADADVARVSQLTLRTNQFNLTTRRLQQAELRTLASDPDVRVLTVRAGDRFGDNGLIGAVFTRRSHDVVHIDNFLLSCRAFARRIEHAVLAEVLRQARDSGASAVLGEYVPSAKNARYRDFYPDNGFEPLPGRLFRHRLATLPPVPEHICLTTTSGDSAR